MRTIPNGSRVNCFTSGGAHGGPRLELVKAAAPRAPTITAEDVERFITTEQLDPGRIYAARKPDHLASDKPVKAPESTIDAGSIYAARSAHV